MESTVPLGVRDNGDAGVPPPLALAPPPPSFGGHLRLARLTARLSQRELALLVGVRQPTVYGWETNRNLPRPEHVARLVAIVGCPSLGRHYFASLKARRRAA